MREPTLFQKALTSVAIVVAVIGWPVHGPLGNPHQQPIHYFTVGFFLGMLVGFIEHTLPKYLHQPNYIIGTGRGRGFLRINYWFLIVVAIAATIAEIAGTILPMALAGLIVGRFVFILGPAPVIDYADRNALR